MYNLRSSSKLLSIVDEVEEQEKKEKIKPTVERRKTKQEEKYNDFVKKLLKKQNKKGLK